MATQNIRTVTGSRPASGIADAHFDAGYAVQIDTARDGNTPFEIAYELTDATANQDSVYAVLGNKDSNISATTGARDTLITGGIAMMRFASTYNRTTHKGRSVVCSATAGIVQHHATDGKGRIVGGGTATIGGSTVNVVYVDLDAR